MLISETKKSIKLNDTGDLIINQPFTEATRLNSKKVDDYRICAPILKLNMII